MKIVDIVPGAFYALPANKVSGYHWTLHLKDGTISS